MFFNSEDTIFDVAISGTHSRRRPIATANDEDVSGESFRKPLNVDRPDLITMGLAIVTESKDKEHPIILYDCE